MMAQLVGQAIGAAFWSLVIALIIQWATKKVAKFKPPYGMAYLSALLGTLAGLIAGFVLGLAVGMAEESARGGILLMSMVAGFVLQGAIYGSLIKDSTGTPIGAGKGFAVAGIQLAVGLAILAAITVVVLVSVR